MNPQYLELLHVLALGYYIGQYFQRCSKKAGRWYLRTMLVALAVIVTVVFCLAAIDQLWLLYQKPIDWILFFFGANGTESGLDFLTLQISAHAAFAILGFLGVSIPLSSLFLLFKKPRQDSRPRLKSFPRRKFFEPRKNSYRTSYLAGLDARDGKPIYISDAARLLHTQIIGVTGAAKTEGGIIPPLVHDILWGRGAIIIDMKGDVSLLDRITAAISASGREKDFYFLSLAKPEISNTYNPLIRGNASEKMNKIISSLEWSEPYYKKMSEMACLSVCKAYGALKRPLNFRELHRSMSSIKSLERLSAELRRKKLEDYIAPLRESLEGSTRALTGLLSDFLNVIQSDFADLLSPESSEINLLDCYLNNKVVLFQFPSGLYEETAVRLARMLIQDIKSVSNHIQNRLPEEQRRFFPIFIDEFAVIAFPAFIHLINKARSAKIAITIAHQSLGDLKQHGEFMRTQIFENTNIRLVFRQNDPESVNILTQMGGTVETQKMTHQTSNMAGMEVNTGMGSSRTAESFRIDPNLVKEMPLGYCVLHQKDKNRIHYLQTDYLPIKPTKDFLKQRKRDDTSAKTENYTEKSKPSSTDSHKQSYFEAMP